MKWCFTGGGKVLRRFSSTRLFFWREISAQFFLKILSSRQQKSEKQLQSTLLMVSVPFFKSFSVFFFKISRFFCLFILGYHVMATLDSTVRLYRLVFCAEFVTLCTYFTQKQFSILLDIMFLYIFINLNGCPLVKT